MPKPKKNRAPTAPVAPAVIDPKRDAELYERTKSDQRILIESCFSIVDGDTQKEVPFLLRKPQSDYWDARTLCDAILKSRKIGFSALIDAEFLTDAILKENCRIVVVAHRDEDVDVHLKRIVWMKDHLPFDVPVKEQNDGGMEFTATGSTMRVISALAKDPGRGSDTTHLKLTERAFYRNDTFLAAVEGSCVKNARRVIETTANGAGTPFHKFWLRTKRGETAYKDHFFAWWTDPRNEVDATLKDLGRLDEQEIKLVEAYNLGPRKLAWRRLKLREMTNPDLFPQEYPANDVEAFLASGRMVFDWIAIEKLGRAAETIKFRGRLEQRAQRRVEFEPMPDGPLSVWVQPKEDRRYLISADVAEGLSDGAWSVADVIDLASWEQVAQWRGHVSPMAFADVLGDLGAYYNWAQVAPEVNNHGLATISRLQAEGYPALYARESAGGRTDYGWLTTAKSKMIMVNGLAHMVRNLELKVNSQETLDELKSFVHLKPEDGKSGNTFTDRMGPQAGAFADCVMSLAIGAALLGERRETPATTRQRFREALGMNVSRRTELPPSGPGYGVRRA